MGKVTLVTGPPGAGKNHYISEHMKADDLVVDLDVLREQYPALSLVGLQTLQQTIEDAAHASEHDAWVIRCVADGEKRTELARRIKADEVVVIETPADVAKAQIRSRGRHHEKFDELDTAVDSWWSQYGVVGSDVIVKPGMGDLSDRKKNTMSKENESTDRGFPADTPLAEMTETQQVAYWKHQSRKHENTVKDQKDYADLKQELEARRNGTFKEPAKEKEGEDKVAPFDVESFKAELRKELAAENAPKLVKAQFKTLIGNRLPEDKADLLIDDLDHTKYLAEDGSLDIARIKERAELIAPAPLNNRSTRTHQGRRKAEGSHGVAAGRDLFEQKHGTKTS